MRQKSANGASPKRLTKAGMVTRLAARIWQWQASGARLGLELPIPRRWRRWAVIQGCRFWLPG
ncbi:MAG: hypothetical protein ACK2UA_01455 [Anaerolineae bacterium]|jgi:hypothetical protein